MKRFPIEINNKKLKVCFLGNKVLAHWVLLIIKVALAKKPQSYFFFFSLSSNLELDYELHYLFQTRILIEPWILILF